MRDFIRTVYIKHGSMLRCVQAMITIVLSSICIDINYSRILTPSGAVF